MTAHGTDLRLVDLDPAAVHRFLREVGPAARRHRPLRVDVSGLPDHPTVHLPLALLLIAARMSRQRGTHLVAVRPAQPLQAALARVGVVVDRRRWQRPACTIALSALDLLDGRHAADTPPVTQEQPPRG